MKKLSILFIVTLLFPTALFNCGGSGASLSDENISNAVGATFASGFIVSMMTAFGKEVKGAEYDKKTNVTTFKNFSFKDLQNGDDLIEEFGYTSMSGTFSGNEKESNITMDVTLEGGPVKTLKYSIGADVMQGKTQKVKIDVVANGTARSIEFTPDTN